MDKVARTMISVAVDGVTILSAYVGRLTTKRVAPQTQTVIVVDATTPYATLAKDVVDTVPIHGVSAISGIPAAILVNTTVTGITTQAFQI